MPELWTHKASETWWIFFVLQQSEQCTSGRKHGKIYPPFDQCDPPVSLAVRISSHALQIWFTGLPHCFASRMPAQAVKTPILRTDQSASPPFKHSSTVGIESITRCSKTSSPTQHRGARPTTYPYLCCTFQPGMKDSAATACILRRSKDSHHLLGNRRSDEVRSTGTPPG